MDACWVALRVEAACLRPHKCAMVEECCHHRFKYGEGRTVVYSCLRFRLFSATQDWDPKAMFLNHFNFTAVAHVESQTTPQHNGHLSNSLPDDKTSLLDQKASNQKVCIFPFLHRLMLPGSATQLSCLIPPLLNYTQTELCPPEQHWC